MIVFDASTKLSSEFPKALVIFPQSNAKLGMAVPMATAPIVPKIIKIISVFVAKRKSSRN